MSVPPVPTAQRPVRRDFALVVLGAVLWGAGGLTGAALADAGLAPLAVAAARIGLGGLVLLAVLVVGGRLDRAALRTALTGAALIRVLVVAGLLAVYQAAYFTAVVRTSVSVATLVALGAAPVLVAVAVSVAGRRLPDRRVLVGIGLALVGLTLLIGPDLGTGRVGVVGPLLALTAAAAFATVTLVNRRRVVGLDPVVMTGVSFSIGGLVLVPFALTAPAPDLAAGAALRLVLLVVFLAVVPTAAAWAAYFSGLRSVPATVASLVALLEPLTAAVGAAVLRGDRLGVAGVLGGVALAAATFTVRPRSRTGPRLAYDGHRSVPTAQDRPVDGRRPTRPPSSDAGS